jgi:imidazolonepropionase-like amidohydrolase
MKIIAASVVLFITFTLCLIVIAQPSTRTVISGATVIDGAGRAPIKNAVIVIEGNRIKQIGARGEINLPKNAQVIDAAGKYIIPGLADMHIHPGNGFFPPGRGGALNFKKVYAQMLAWGFTTVFSPLGPGLYEQFKSLEGAKAYYGRFSKFTPERMGIIKNNLRKVHDAGILVVAGTDTGVPGVLLGPSSQTELVILVEDGLKVEDALRTATINAAKMLKREKEQGALETGKLADLVILDADPLADIRNIRRIHRVLKAGVVYDPAKLLRTT